MPPGRTPLSDRQRELARQQDELERRMAELQELIEEAPRRKQAELERRRRMLVDRASRISGASPDVPASLRSHTFRARTVGGPAPRMRAEQKAQRLRFIVLLVVLALIALLLLSKLDSL